MRVVARQNWRLQIVRIAIGCAVICAGLQLMLSAASVGLLDQQTRQLFVMLPAGILIMVTGIAFAIYARFEWRPRGVAVAMTRRGLILKANDFRCPRLVAIKWTQIRGAKYIAPTLLPYKRARVSVFLVKPMSRGTLPTKRGGVVALRPDTTGLTGI